MEASLSIKPKLPPEKPGQGVFPWLPFVVGAFEADLPNTISQLSNSILADNFPLLADFLGTEKGATIPLKRTHDREAGANQVEMTGQDGCSVVLTSKSNRRCIELRQTTKVSEEITKRRVVMMWVGDDGMTTSVLDYRIMEVQVGDQRDNVTLSGCAYEVGQNEDAIPVTLVQKMDRIIKPHKEAKNMLKEDIANDYEWVWNPSSWDSSEDFFKPDDSLTALPIKNFHTAEV